MISISNFFKLSFKDRNITNERLNAFALSNLSRLDKNNINGQLDALVTDTRKAVIEFRDAMVEKEVEYAEQQAQTIRLKELVGQIILTVRRRASYIRWLDQGDGILYEAFFPNGLAEISRLRRYNEQQLIMRLAETAEQYADVIGAEMALEFRQLYAMYKKEREAQLDQKAGVDFARIKVIEKREALERQLAINALTLGLAYYGDAQMAKVFFREELLVKRRTARSVVDEEMPEVPDG